MAINRKTLGRGAGLAAVLAFVAFWAWAFSPWAPNGNRDELSDRSYADPAEARCRAASDALDAVPNAREARSVADRAGELEQANTILRSMVADLRALVTGNDNDRRVLGLWLTDWDQYVRDREDYVPQLRADPAARFGVSQREGAQITRAIDSFANRNHMPHCTSPHDV